MTITLEDGSKVSVSICDEHAEEATVKTAKLAYLKKQDAIQAVLEQARALGLNISDSKPSGLVIVQETIKPQPKQQVSQLERKQAVKTDLGNDLDPSDPNVVSTAKLDSLGGMRSVGGSVGTSNVESLSSHDLANLKEKLDPNIRRGTAKLESVEGRGGQPIVIPTVRKDGTGTTRINIVKTSDAALQESFKKMASDSREDRLPNFARQGYNNTTRNCPICYGNGEVGGKDCPKCGGQGIISVY